MTHKAKTNKPKRRPLPDHLHTIRIEHEPASTQCACGCQLRRIGEDVSEKLHFRPAQFYKEQHVRGKWVCDQCDTLTQQAMPAYVIDKGIASPELLSHALVSKYADHLPLYRQRLIYQRAGIELSRSTLSDWIGRCGVELEPLANALKRWYYNSRCCMQMKHRSPSCGWVRMIKTEERLCLGLCHYTVQSSSGGDL